MNPAYITALAALAGLAKQDTAGLGGMMESGALDPLREFAELCPCRIVCIHPALLEIL